jgi:hypothetical protein
LTAEVFILSRVRCCIDVTKVLHFVHAPDSNCIIDLLQK